MNVIILPAFNEESSINHVLTSIDATIKNLKKEFIIIICNDGSLDETLQEIKKSSKIVRTPVQIINHNYNRGLGETVRDLLEVAVLFADQKDDVIIRMDCDKTHNPKYIPDLLKEIGRGFDVVTASRFFNTGGQTGVTRVRQTISKMANIYMKLFFPIKGLREYSCGYRAYRSSIIKRALTVYGNDFIQLKEFGFTCTLEKIVKLNLIGARFSEIPFVLNYDLKTSKSKMVFTSTTLGYFILAILCYWPFGGWKSRDFDELEPH
jgi:dolichol-phosphate mannosyltransferase